jgi:hypothetical protein
MPDPNEQDVNSAPVTPSPEAPESVNEQPAGEVDQSTVDTTTPEPGQEQPETVTPVSTPSPVEAVDEQGVPWKNRAVEAARRLQDTQDIVKQTIQETLQSQQTKAKEVYTKEHIPMLKQYAQEHPEYTGWVENQIDDIKTREIAGVVEQKLTGFQKAQQDEQTKRQAESWITNDPVFKECFIATPTGKVWNQTNPLSQQMMQILNSPDPMTGKLVKDRPDALYVAADIAYGRYARANLQKGNTQVQKLRKDLAKVNKAANVVSPGKGAPSSAPRNPVKVALDNYSKTYSRSDIQNATKQHLLGLGLLKEE